MSTLKERIDRIREGFKKQAPPEVLAIMDNARAELSASGIMDRIPKVGDLMPAFELPDTEGQAINSGTLLAAGPAVITFYRGVW